MLLYDRARLSQMNNWLDENGRIYVIYPITELIKHIGKCRSSIKSALKELDEAGLLVRRSGGFSKPNHLYIKIPVEEIYQKDRNSTQLENGRSYKQPLNSLYAFSYSVRSKLSRERSPGGERHHAIVLQDMFFLCLIAISYFYNFFDKCRNPGYLLFSFMILLLLSRPIWHCLPGSYNHRRNNNCVHLV